jgi:hypothetical protein
MNDKISHTLRIITLSFILSTTIGISLADWASPAGGPPSNNIPPPINVGAASQTRDGNLFLNNWLVAKKVQTQSTVAGDAGTTVVTKDYLDGQISTTKKYVDDKIGSIVPKRSGCVSEHWNAWSGGGTCPGTKYVAGFDVYGDAGDMTALCCDPM